MTPEEYERHKEEMFRVTKGDGELRLWRVEFNLMDLHGMDGKLMPGYDGVAEVHAAYARAIMQLGTLAASWTIPGCPQEHTWWIWADGHDEAERLVCGSPAAHYDMVNGIKVKYPYKPVRVAPGLEKSLRPPLRHPTMVRIMRSDLSSKEVIGYMDDDRSTDAERFLMMYLFWARHEALRREDPNLDKILRERALELWPKLVSMAAAISNVERTELALEEAKRNVRKGENSLAEWGVDIVELRRRMQEFSDRGEPLPPDFWYDMPMKYPVDFPTEPSVDEDDEESDEG